MKLAIGSLFLALTLTMGASVIAVAPSSVDSFPEMAMAVRNPASILAIPKNPSTQQAATAEFTSSDSTYWMVEYTYSGASCNSKVVLKNAIATGYCIRTGISSSVKYACTSVSSCTALVYTADSTCASATPTVYDFPLGVCSSMDADDDGYLTDDGAVFTMQQAFAVQGYPSGFSDGSSGVMSNYNSQTCAQNTMYSYRIGYENHCYSNFDGTDYTSAKYSDPNLISYTGANCVPTNVVSTTPAPSGSCLINSATSSSKTTLYKNDNKNSLSAGAIAGIVIGCVAGVAIIAALVYFFVFHQAKAPLGQQGAASSSNV